MKKIITFPQTLFDNVIERNSVVWVKTRNVSEDTWVTISNDSNPRRFEDLKTFRMPTFSSNINPLTCCQDGNHITWPKRSCFWKWKYKSVGCYFFWDLNRVRLLQTHLPGLRDSVVGLDLCQSIPDWHSNSNVRYQSHLCFEEAFFPSILCHPHPQGHADCEITWQSKVDINTKCKAWQRTFRVF